MSKIVTALINVIPFQAPAGTVPGIYRVALVRAGDTSTIIQSIDTADLTVSFQDIPAGTYQVAAVRLDSDGAVIGSAAISDVFAIYDENAPATVTIDIPESVAVTVA